MWCGGAASRVCGRLRHVEGTNYPRVGCACSVESWPFAAPSTLSGQDSYQLVGVVVAHGELPLP